MISLNKKRICAFLLTLLLVALPQTAGLFVMQAAALNFYVENPLSGTIAKPTANGVVTHYEFNIAADASTASFQVSITGDDFIEPLLVSMSATESASHPVSSVSINGGGPSATIPNALPFTVAFALNNEDFYGYATGNVKMDISVQSTGALLGSVPFVINRGSQDASEEVDEDEIIDPNAENDYSDYDGTGAGSIPIGMEDFAELLEDADYRPEIAINGNTAKLTYVTSMAAWSTGEAAQNVLTLSDISRLQPDMPLEVPGPAPDPQASPYTVTLPAWHINAVLEAKAADIAAKLSAGTYREEPNGHDGSTLLLVPSALPSALEHTVLSPFTEGFVPVGEGGLALYADAQSLQALEAPAVIEAAVFYKGIASPTSAKLAMPVLHTDEPDSGDSEILVDEALWPLGVSPAGNGMTARGVGIIIVLAAMLSGAAFLLLRARKHMRVR